MYKHYLKSIGVALSITTVVLNMVFQGFSIGSNLWLSVWSDDQEIIVNGSVNTAKRDMYLGVYGALGIGQGKSSLHSPVSLECSLCMNNLLYKQCLVLYYLHNTLLFQLNFGFHSKFLYSSPGHSSLSNTHRFN